MPLTLPLGEYFVLCEIDINGAVDVEEGTDANNAVISANTINIVAPSEANTPWARTGVDLVVQPVTDSLVMGSGRLSLEFSVRNNGSSATRHVQWQDAIVLSSDDVYDSTIDTLLFPTRAHSGPLQPGQLYVAPTLRSITPQDNQ